MVINELPVGSIVFLGSYRIADVFYELEWIKVSKDNHFISKYVLNGMQYDAHEGYSHNYDYHLSNIRQYMNSEDASWYKPTHPNDSAPSYFRYESYTMVNPCRWPGMLYHFNDGDMSCIDQENGDYFRLPTVNEIMRGGFPYFNRKGKRAHPLPEYCSRERGYYSSGAFSSYFMLDDTRRDGLAELSRSGSIDRISPTRYSGIRPVCKLKADSIVEGYTNNTYKCVPDPSKARRYFEETQSIDWLLGI